MVKKGLFFLSSSSKTLLGFRFRVFYQELVVTGTKPQTLTVAGDECGDGAGSSFKHTGGVGVDQHSCHQLAVDGGPVTELIKFCY